MVLIAAKPLTLQKWQKSTMNVSSPSPTLQDFTRFQKKTWSTIQALFKDGMQKLLKSWQNGLSHYMGHGCFWTPLNTKAAAIRLIMTAWNHDLKTHLDECQALRHEASCNRSTEVKLLSTSAEFLTVLRHCQTPSKHLAVPVCTKNWQNYFLRLYDIVNIWYSIVAKTVTVTLKEMCGYLFWFSGRNWSWSGGQQEHFVGIDWVPVERNHQRKPRCKRKRKTRLEGLHYFPMCLTWPRACVQYLKSQPQKQMHII